MKNKFLFLGIILTLFWHGAIRAGLFSM